MGKYKPRKPVKFEEGVAVKATFDFDPSTAKSFEQDSKFSESGKTTKYSVAVNKDEIIFATPALYEKIRNFNKDDTVTITFAEKRWVVTSNGTSHKDTDEVKNVLENTETAILLRKVALDVDMIKNHLFGKTDENKDTKEDEETIDF